MPVQVSSCCCGCGLRIGSIIIGVALAAVAGLTGVFEGIREAFLFPMLSAPMILFCIHAAWGVICVIMNIVLVVGAVAKNPHLVRAWVWFTIISLHVHCLITIAGNVMTTQFGEPLFSGFITFILLVRASVLIYCLLVVNSFHTQLTRPSYAEDYNYTVG